MTEKRARYNGGRGDGNSKCLFHTTEINSTDRLKDNECVMKDLKLSLSPSTEVESEPKSFQGTTKLKQLFILTLHSFAVVFCGFQLYSAINLFSSSSSFFHKASNN
ncbi:hypothetical protein LOAG_01210 [Loa loa]|uniref:Uncharacterized protein n=1 Tax=Loa loa TaxID=7209 RepID=A0A1S0U9L3_LOALO|nr:hypothetical protein LOAG_01210 [Loa loa]EFO27273.1 hypothetical protein LOAG_01210 [Loa loa]